MPLVLGEKVVIYDDLVLKIGYKKDIIPINGMIRFNPLLQSFEMYKNDEWFNFNMDDHKLLKNIRYNEKKHDYEFSSQHKWYMRYDCGCPEPPPCPECPEPPPCPDPEPCETCEEILKINPNTQRHYILSKVNSWQSCDIGGPGTTTDIWDLSTLPLNGKLSISFNSFIIPKRFLIEYPINTLVYDTGWKSDYPTHAINMKFSDLTVLETHNIDNIFEMNGPKKFKITAFGTNDRLSKWSYSIRYIL